MDESRPSPLFVGRDDDSSTLFALLTNPTKRLITIVGIGGIGKTTLARHIAETAHDHDTGEVVYLDLADLNDPALVPLRLMSLLGLDTVIPAQAIDVIVDHLKERQALIVFDNFEHVTAAKGLLETIHAACPRVWQLATSRAPIDLPAETVYFLAPLATPLSFNAVETADLADNPAVQVLIHHIRQAQPSFAFSSENAQAIVGICQKLDGIPLALELSARRLSGLLSVQEIDRHLNLRLVEVSSADGQPEQRLSLPALLHWSYDRLDPTQQLVCRVLAIFAGGATVDAVISVLNRVNGQIPETSEVVAALEVLSRLGFVQVDRGKGATRFSMLRLLREFVCDVIAGDKPSEQALREAHAHYCVTLAGAAGPGLDGADPRLSLELIDGELHNLRQAMSWFNQHDQGEGSLDIAGTTWGFWRQQGKLAEILQWLERGIVACDTRSSVMRARAYLYVGHSIQGDPARRSNAYRQAFQQFQTLDYLIGQTGALDSLALVQLDQGEYLEAEQTLRRALDLAERSGDQKSRGFVFNHLGSVQTRLGELSAAHESLKNALAIWREFRAIENVAYVLFELGRLERQRQRYWPSEDYLRKSESVFRQAGSIVGQGYALQELGQTLLAQNKLEAAYRAFHDALKLLAESGLCDEESISTIEGIACVAIDQQPATAAHLLAAAAHWRTHHGFTRLPVNDDLVARGWRRLKQAISDQRLEQIRVVAELDEWEAVLRRALNQSLTWGDAPILTTAEREVLQQTALGMRDKEIATLLGVTSNTVRTHQQNIRRKLGATSRTQAVHIAISLGLIDPV